MSRISDVQVDTYMHANVDLFELVVHHYWELESRKTTYINVDQLAETPCPARMMSSKYTQLYKFRLPVLVASKDNQLNKVCTYMQLWSYA